MFNNKKVFIYSSSLSYIFLLGSVCLFAFPSIFENASGPTNLNNHYIFKNLLQIISFCLVLSVLFGYAAVFTGKKILCKLCHGPMLSKKLLGFHLLTPQPVLSMIQDKQVCSHCSNNPSCEQWLKLTLNLNNFGFINAL